MSCYTRLPILKGDGNVTNKDVGKKKAGWFNPFNSNQDQVEEDSVHEPVNMTDTITDETFSSMAVSEDKDIQMITCYF